jgi:hypothetical protein
LISFFPNISFRHIKRLNRRKLYEDCLQSVGYQSGKLPRHAGICQIQSTTVIVIITAQLSTIDSKCCYTLIVFTDNCLNFQGTKCPGYCYKTKNAKQLDRDSISIKKCFDKVSYELVCSYVILWFYDHCRYGDTKNSDSIMF